MSDRTTSRGGRKPARRIIGWAGAGLAVAALALPLGACRQDSTAEQAGKKIDEAVGATKDSAEKAAENAKRIAEEAAEKAKQAAESAKEKIKEKM